jgi:para-nitrobenzyl esterase
MESGSIPLGQIPPLAVAEAGGTAFAAGLGCSKGTDVLACLRAVPADTIVTQPNIFVLGPGVGSPFLPTDPFVVLQQRGSPVPLVIGSTREEWAGVSDDPNAPLDDNGYVTAIHQRFDPIGSGVADHVLKLYPVTSYDTPEYALIAVDTDYNMSCEVRNVARAAVGVNRPPVWRYFYTHRFHNDAFLNSYRAFHTAELYFVFGNFNGVFGIDYIPTSAERTFSNDLMGYWARFAATGDPNGSGATAWPPYDATSDPMLRLDDNFARINGYHNKECDYLSTLPQP